MKLATLVDGAWRLLAAGQFVDASETAHQILRDDPNNVAALSCAAMADWELGRPIPDAIALLERASTLAPNVGAIWHNLATVHASNGDMEAAGNAFERALQVNPKDTRAFFSLTQNRRFAEETDLVRDMLQLYGSGALDRASLEFLCFGLAKVYADLGNPSRAMHFCIEANWLADRPWDQKAQDARMDAIRDLAENKRFVRSSRTYSGPAPVFIVGMPRSGTTLVEAILSRHPDVHTLGETVFLHELDRDLTNGDPRRIPGLLRDRLKVAAENTLRQMRAGAPPEARLIVDKTPANAFEIGLIAALFPNARIIHMRRHPLDCGLSNLFTRFTRGQGFSFRQTDLGTHIRQTAEVMKLWQSCDLLPILDVSYEAVVAAPEQQARRIIDFLGLEWNEACLTPEQARRSIHTASQYQVRQKINSNSVGRHAGYREWLQPLIESLGGNEWIEAEFVDQQRASMVP